MVDGLPVGLQLIGAHFDESTIYRAAHAFEQLGDWKKMLDGARRGWEGAGDASWII